MWGSVRNLEGEASCDECQVGSLTALDWLTASSSRPKSDEPKASNFKVCSDEMKSGALLQCPACKTYWYLDERKKYLKPILESKIELVKEWGSKPIRLTGIQRLVLANIGGTPPHYYGSGSKRIVDTPCSVTTKDGDKFDFAIVSKSREAPCGKEMFRLASEIEFVSPSPYALPLAVRQATSQAIENRMCYWPTFIELSDGSGMILNYVQNF